MLWGECLAVYSHAAGKVVDSDGQPMKIGVVLRKATELVEEILVERHLLAETAINSTGDSIPTYDPASAL
jgi:hypothetical protein